MSWSGVVLHNGEDRERNKHVGNRDRMESRAIDSEKKNTLITTSFKVLKGH